MHVRIKKLRRYLLQVILVLFFTGTLAFSNQINFKIFTKEEICSFVIDKIDQGVVYASSSRSIYRSHDKGESWDRIYTIGNVDTAINALYFDAESFEIFAATQDGLYVGSNQGNDWQRIFIGSSDLEKDCLSVAKTSTATYVGTRAGLFVRYNQRENWVKPFEQLSEGVISSIVVDLHKEAVYIACERGVFTVFDNGKAPERIFVVYGSEIPDEDYSDFDGEVSEQVETINDMAVPLHKEGWLYIATIKGIFVSKNGGKRWERITNISLPSIAVRSLVVSDNGEQLFAATGKGVFQLFSGRWQKIKNGARDNDCNDMLIDKEGFLWVAGREGIFKIELGKKAENSGLPFTGADNLRVNFNELFQGEPTIEATQKAAIEYAEANMNKIKSWRKQARLKALFPTVSVGYDKNVYGSSSGAMAVGPRDWDIDLSWDVADLIWSSDQTSIDSRSRLTVQLRQDIVDQVTHLFYERQRLKAALLLSPPQSEQELFFKRLELQEITANIDALTDGYFSHFTQDSKS